MSARRVPAPTAAASSSNRLSEVLLAGLTVCAQEKRPKYAGPKADPDGVLNDQAILDYVAEQIVRTGERENLCKGLVAWCSTQKVGCSPTVYRLACSVFGVGDEQKRDYLLERLMYFPHSRVAGGLVYSKRVDGVLVDTDRWKLCFTALCTIHGADTEGLVVVDYQQTPFEWAQLTVHARLVGLPYEGDQLVKVRALAAVAEAALGADRVTLREQLLNSTVAYAGATTPEAMVAAFTANGQAPQADIWVKDVAGAYSPLDKLLALKTGAPGVQWVQWMLDLPNYSPHLRDEQGLTALENQAYAFRNHNYPFFTAASRDRELPFTLFLTHPMAFVFRNPNGDTLAHIMVMERLIPTDDVRAYTSSIKLGLSILFAAAERCGKQVIRETFLEKNRDVQTPKAAYMRMVQAHNAGRIDRDIMYTDYADTLSIFKFAKKAVLPNYGL